MSADAAQPAGADPLFAAAHDLQQQESALVDQLQAGQAPAQQRAQIALAINQLAHERLALWERAHAAWTARTNRAERAQARLPAEWEALRRREAQLTVRKDRLNALRSQTHSFARLLSIQTYYHKRYAAHTQLTRIAIAYCAGLIALFVLRPWLPTLLFDLGFLCLSGYALIIGIGQIADISRRDPTDWDRYLFPFSPAGAPALSAANPALARGGGGGAPEGNDASLAGAGNACQGAACCAQPTVFFANQCRSAADIAALGSTPSESSAPKSAVATSVSDAPPPHAA